MSRNTVACSLILTVLAVFCAYVLQANGEDVAGRPGAPVLTAVSVPVPLSETAAARVDPRIRLVMSLPGKTESAYAGIGRSMVLAGESPSTIRFPVLVRSSLSDGELAALGAIVESRAGDIVTAEVLPVDMDRLASHPGVLRVEGSYWLAPSLDVSIPEIRADLINQGEPSDAYTGEGVLFGLIDDGIDITHQDFIDDEGSRILYIWDQHRTSNATPPGGYSYGHEYTKADIDAGRAGAFVNTGGHGSHVAGIAVGNGLSSGGQYQGVAWKADIIAVRNGYCDLFCYGSNNPLYTWWEGGGTTKGSIDALEYMIGKSIDEDKPLVVNQSQGVALGPHDGSTLFEQAYQNLVDLSDLIIAVAAGNNQGDDWHGRATVSPGGQADFTINKDNTSQADQWLQFECWGMAGDRFRWEVRTPGGQTISIPAAVTPVNELKMVTTGYGDLAAYWSTAADESNGQPMFVFYAENNTGVQGGNWQVRAIADNPLPSGGQVDLYCERNQYTVKVTGNLNTESIVGMPGTATGVITVASYNTKNNWQSMDGPVNPQGYPLGEISRFSSHGPRRDGAQKPDIAAPGAWVMSAFASDSDPQNEMGVLRDPGGMHICYQGTSMSSPHVAGAIALMLQKDGTLGPEQVKTILQETARADAFTGVVPNSAFGYGKLDVKAAVDMVEGGSGECATVMGDADGNDMVNILDLVATVNHILNITPLSDGGQACADVQTDGIINILDVVGIVNIIMTGFAPPPVALGGGDRDTGPVAWSEEAAASSYLLTLDGSRLGGIQLSYYLPRGYEADGGPIVRGGLHGARLSHAVRGRLHTLILYASGGGALGTGDVTLEIPLRKAWDGGQGIGDFGISHLVLSDPSACPLEPAPVSRGFGESPESAGMGLFLARTAPNPSAEVTRIEYSLELNGDVSLAVFDASGRRVRDLWNGWQMAGGHVVAWDGRDDAGTPVPAGVYFVQLRGASDRDSRKLLIVR